MKRMLRAVIYTAFVLGANHALAGPPALAALLEGDMRKLVLHEAPRPAPANAFVDATGKEHRLSDWRGKVVLVNFWATWCAPCRKEMPALDRLQESLGGEHFTVVTIATGRNSLAGIEKFFAEAKVQHLPVLLDPRSELARAALVVGLPVTVILDAEGREIARLTGEADWDSASAHAVIKALTGP